MKEQLQTAAQNPCDALTMTKTLLVGDRKSGCKMKNDGMQMSYFAINYALYILAQILIWTACIKIKLLVDIKLQHNLRIHF